jgi:hypothetical protein
MSHDKPFKLADEYVRSCPTSSTVAADDIFRMDSFGISGIRTDAWLCVELIVLEDVGSEEPVRCGAELTRCGFYLCQMLQLHCDRIRVGIVDFTLVDLQRKGPDSALYVEFRCRCGRVNVN